MTSPATAVRRRDVGLRSDRGPVLGALMLTTGLVAIDATILATAVVSIVDDLGGYALFPWLFSIYLLTQAVVVPIASKLADTVGRRPVLLAGIGVFLLGSVLCAVSPSMGLLIAGRAVQGLGAGALSPVAITIAGDIYTVAERAVAQGYLAGVWAVSSVVGPALGGVFSQFLSWRWIFWVDVPLGALAVVMLLRGYREPARTRDPDAPRSRPDVAGALTLAVGFGALLLWLLQGGRAWAWLSTPSAVVGTLAVVALVAAVLVERRAAEPVLPFALLGRRLVLSCLLVSLGVGAVLIGLTSFVPNLLERAGDASPLVAGFAVAALTIGWPIAASLSGRVYLRFGFRPTVVLGAVVATAGAAMLLLVTPAVSVWLTALSCLVVGLGLGLAASPSIIAVQSSVGHDERGVVTGATVFFRAIGSAVAVAVFGAVTNVVSGDAVDAASVTSASRAVFVGVVVAGVVTLAAALAMPKARASTG